VPPAFYSQCPICGQTGSTGWSLSTHYGTEHPEFYARYRRLKSQFARVSLTLVLVALGLVVPTLIGLMRLSILGLGAIILGWFAYFLISWQPKFDDLSDRSNDEWRKNGKSSTLDGPVQDSSRRTSNSIVCPICKQGPYRVGLGIRYHNRILHAEYFAWYNRWILLVEKIAILTALVLLASFTAGLLDPLESSQFAPVILVVPALSLVLAFATNRSKKQTESRRAWIENHPN
jgi:hypothetical protein